MVHTGDRRWIPTEHPRLKEMEKQAEPARRELAKAAFS